MQREAHACVQLKLATIALHDTGRHEVAAAAVAAVRVARVGHAVTALAHNYCVLLALLDSVLSDPAQAATAAAARGPLPSAATATADSHHRNGTAEGRSPLVGA